MLQTSLMQSLLSRVSPTAPKQLELTPGQVVKGTVVQLYPDSTALVQVGGMQVHARLEASLEAGQKAWLQVQPSSDLLTLKILLTPQNAPDASLEGLMNSLGIPDTKENRKIVQALVNGNLPINKELIEAFSQIVKNQGLSDATVEAFLLAVKRNLPLTNDALGGLKAFLSDQSLTKSIQSFLRQAENFLQIDDTATGMAFAESAESARTRASSSLADANSNGSAGTASSVPNLQFNGAAGSTSNGRTTTAMHGNGTPGQMSNGISTARQSSTTADASGEPTFQGLRQTVQLLSEKLANLPLSLLTEKEPGDQQAGKSGSGPIASDGIEKGGTAAGTASRLSGVPGQAMETASAAGKTGATQPGNQQQASSEPTSIPHEITNTPNAVQQSQTPGQKAMEQAAPVSSAAAGVNRHASATQPPIQTSVGQLSRLGSSEHFNPAANLSLNASIRSGGEATGLPANPLREFFHHLGLMHERQIMQRSISPGAAELMQDNRFDNVKSLLMLVSQSPANTVPGSLREAADSLLQQITGQQLMLAQQPSAQIISQIIMQVPLKTEQGEETAYIQIEAKKREGGQLDAENCRLLFNLDLQQLGITMVDVAIVNRIVNVQIFNDQPWLDGLAYQMKDKFASQLRDTGYQLSSMRVMPLPELQPKTIVEQAKGNLMNDYKGVDFRV